MGLLERLAARQKELESTLDKWRRLESGVEENTDFLQEVRREVTGALPDHYDDLQKHVQHCKVG